MNRDLTMVRQIAEHVNKLGGRTFYVGGFVRDKILGYENKDIDIEVHGIEFTKLQNILTQLGNVDERKVGESFGILNLKSYDIDIALPRTEQPSVDSPSHKDFVIEVDPFIGYEKAARRRDFTMNALMEDVLTGEILDYFGGLNDIQDKQIRHIDSQTFVEDPLRVFRAAQLAARFDFDIADDTIALSKTIPVDKLTHERVAGELDKALLKSKTPSKFFNELRKMDQLKTWFPEIHALIGVQQDPIHHPEGNVYNHTMMVLDEAAKLKKKASNAQYFMVAALCHDFGKYVTTKFNETKGKWQAIDHDVVGGPIARTFVDRIWYENKMKSYVENMTTYHMKPLQMVKASSGKTRFMHLFDESKYPPDLILLAKADNDGRKTNRDFAPYEALLKQRLDEYNDLMVKPHIRGKDLLEAGYEPGPKFSKMLNHAHKMHLAGIDKETSMKQIQGMFGKSPSKDDDIILTEDDLNVGDEVGFKL